MDPHHSSLHYKSSITCSALFIRRDIRDVNTKTEILSLSALASTTTSCSVQRFSGNSPNVSPLTIVNFRSLIKTLQKDAWPRMATNLALFSVVTVLLLNICINSTNDYLFPSLLSPHETMLSSNPMTFLLTSLQHLLKMAVFILWEIISGLRSFCTSWETVPYFSQSSTSIWGPSQNLFIYNVPLSRTPFPASLPRTL